MAAPHPPWARGLQPFAGSGLDQAALGQSLTELGVAVHVEGTGGGLLCVYL